MISIAKRFLYSFNFRPYDSIMRYFGMAVGAEKNQVRFFGFASFRNRFDMVIFKSEFIVFAAYGAAIFGLLA